MLYFIIGLTIIVAAVELPYLFHKKQWGELVVVAGLLLMSLVYSVGAIQSLELPTLNDGVEMLFEPITKSIEGLFS